MARHPSDSFPAWKAKSVKSAKSPTPSSLQPGRATNDQLPPAGALAGQSGVCPPDAAASGPFESPPSDGPDERRTAHVLRTSRGSLEALLKRPDIWRLASGEIADALPNKAGDAPDVSGDESGGASSHAQPSAQLTAQPALAGAPIFCSTGYASLDAALPGGGWPCGATSELLLGVHGVGELRLLLPLFEAVNRRGQWMAWVAPPFTPYAPALAEHGVAIDRLLVVAPEPEEATTGASDLWAAEAVLESKAVPLVLLWHANANVPLRSLRRLQLAAMRSGAALLLLRPANVEGQPSPAVLRMSLESLPGNTLQVTVFKARGLAGSRVVRLALPEVCSLLREG